MAAAGNSMYASKDDATAATIPAGTQFIFTGGDTEAGDGPVEMFVKVLSSPADGFSADGAYWERRQVLGAEVADVGKSVFYDGDTGRLRLLYASPADPTADILDFMDMQYAKAYGITDPA